MSDQQKGLLRAVSDIWPSAEIRVCARHVYCNFRQVFRGSLQYRLGFRELQTARQDLLKRNYKKWVRAYFTPQSKCDSIDNNMNKVFNTYILSSRHKPIITMLEDIRESLMERMHKKRDYIANKDINICPRIQIKLEKSKINVRGWSAFWDGHFTYGVREGATQTRYVVRLLDKTCSCNAWQLSGVPCNHA
ncbi:Type IV secretion system protein virB4, partial [Bienertia sinuspersici]